MMRPCPVCGDVLPESMFTVDATKASGFASRCKPCDNRRNQAYYAANRDARLAAARKRRGTQVPRTRLCPCGAPASSSQHKYCDICKARAIAARNGKPRKNRPEHAKRYGWEHQKERQRVAGIVDAGRALCARCAQPILPGDTWDLDHTDDGMSYRGPAHSYCNRRAGAVKGNRARVLAA